MIHHVLEKQGDEGAEEVLRVPLGTKGEVLPVFSAGWVARAYLSAEAPVGGWHVRACTPDELISLLLGPCAEVEWVALDPGPGHRSGGEAAGMMPHANFVDYVSFSRSPSLHHRGEIGTDHRRRGARARDGSFVEGTEPR
jgi:hypothetical protein